MKSCDVDGCEKPARSAKADWCKMHYHRWYRHGDVNYRATDRSSIVVGTYRDRYLPKHPLAMKNGKVYLHRLALYEEIGGGEHGCHWCNVALAWLGAGGREALVVDHLNGNRDDNRPENLVPTCARCNAARGAQRRSRTTRREGAWSHHDTIARLATGRAEQVEVQRVHTLAA